LEPQKAAGADQPIVEDKKAPKILVSLCDERGNPVLTWHLARALLVKIEAPSLQAGSNDAAIESLELMAAGITIQSA